MKKWLVVLMLLGFSGQLLAEPVDFELKGMDGKTYKLSDYRGKWVLVNYWATWCPPCLEELPELELFHVNHKDTDAVVLGVNMENINTGKLKEFIDEQFLSFPILRAKPGNSSPLGKIPGLPTSYMVSPEGEVVARQVGGITAKALDGFIVRHQLKAEAKQAKVVQ